MVEDIGVNEPDYRQALSFQIRRTLLVVRLALAVRVAIQFDDEPAFGAIEVGDVMAERNLAAELMAVQLPVAQAAPEFLLGRDGFLPHGSSAVEKNWVDFVWSEGH